MQRYITLELHLHSAVQLSTENPESPTKKLMKLWQLVREKETKKQNLLTWKRNSGCNFRTNWMLLQQRLKVDLKPLLS